MNVVAKDVIPQRTFTKPETVLEKFSISKIMDKWKFEKQWANRNIDNGDLTVESLEIEPIIIDQYLFVEESKEIINKLNRIGFKEVKVYPKSELFTFCYAMYNDKYNVAISLYSPKIKTVVKMAEEIAKDTKFGYSDNLTVFLSSVKVLNK